MKVSVNPFVSAPIQTLWDTKIGVLHIESSGKEGGQVITMVMTNNSFVLHFVVYENSVYESYNEQSYI